jgi:predicted nucleotidyltransferase
MTRMQEIRRERAVLRRRDLDRALARLRDLADPAGLSLIPFGSYAEGRVHGNSDLDVAVPGDVSEELRRALIRESERFEAESGIGVDLVFEVETPDFFQRIHDVHQVA